MIVASRRNMGMAAERGRGLRFEPRHRSKISVPSNLGLILSPPVGISSQVRGDRAGG